MKIKTFLTFSVLLVFGLSACDTNRWGVSTDKVNISQSIKRFDADVYSASKQGLSENDWLTLKEGYPDFLPLYVEGIMAFGRLNDPQTKNVFSQYLTNKDIVEVIEEVNKSYPVGSLNSDFEAMGDAFKRYHYFFPDRIIPNVVTMTAAFNYATAANDKLLALGLDMYLGGDFPLYPQIGIPKYKFQNFEREYLVADAMKAWLLTEFEPEGSQNLLEQMVYYGKVIYLVQAFLPQQQEHLAFNYSEGNLLWCEENEGPIWFHFIDMELLFATENHQIRKYMGDAPFVAGFPEGSPGRVGQWVGYQLVNSFMNNNKEVGLEELMQIEDANLILRKSNYKPSR